jgi:hypothetical protein
VHKDGRLFGLADGKVRVEGENADEVWGASKTNPQYFGFDGARAQFLRFFPNGFYSTGYANSERDLGQLTPRLTRSRPCPARPHCAATKSSSKLGL